MLQFFRKIINSKLGVLFALLFLVMIALSFAAADVTNGGKFSSLFGSDQVAKVGSHAISTADLQQAASNGLESLKQDNPRITMAGFLLSGGLTKVLDDMIDRAAISEYGRKNGITAGDRLIDSEIAKLPAFRGPDGKFSESAYRAILQQKGLTDALIREDIGDNLVAKQALLPATVGAVMPTDLVQRYAGLAVEKIEGAVALIPSVSFAPKGEPSDGDIATWYGSHRAAYARPERRVIRYVLLDAAAMNQIPAPTDAEIAASYTANRAQYLPSESRKLAQLVLPTEAAAKTVLEEVTKGKTLEAAAAPKGLSVAAIGPVSKEALSAQSSAAVADAVFAAAKGKITGPIKGPLGWLLIRVDAVEAKPGKTLEQAKGEIITALTDAKRRAALTDFAARTEDSFDKGGSLGDVAKQLNLTVEQTEPLTADGKVYGKPEVATRPELARVVAAAFAMEREHAPQLAEVVPGKTFAMFDVAQIVAAAPAPLAEVRAQVSADIQLQKGAQAAKASAEKLLATVKKSPDPAAALGATLATMTAPSGPLPKVNPVAMARGDLARMQQAHQQVPAPIAMLFAMAQGSAKLLPAPHGMGWYVVVLKTIQPGDIAAAGPGLIAQAQSQLGSLAGEEYADALRKAIAKEVPVKRNPAAITAVSRQLSGTAPAGQ